MHSEFFSLFAGGITVNRPDTPIPLTIPVFYAREATQNRSDIHREQYPHCLLFDHLPDFDEDWNQIPYTLIEGYHNKGSENLDVFDYTKAYKFQEPIRFQFRYDVTFFLSDPFDRMLLTQWVFKRFAKRGQFLFNKISFTTPQDDFNLGDVVSYTVTPTENVREDGIHELNFEFLLKPMIALQDPVEVDLVENFVVGINNIYNKVLSASMGSPYVFINPVVIGDVHGEHIQSSPSSTWTYVHNFGFTPTLSVVDDLGNMIIGYSLEVVSPNTLKIHMGIPMMGKIIAS